MAPALLSLDASLRQLLGGVPRVFLCAPCLGAWRPLFLRWAVALALLLASAVRPPAVPLYAQERQPGAASVGVYALGQLPLGDWRDYARGVLGGGVRVEYGLEPGAVGLFACAEAAGVVPVGGAVLSGGLEAAALGGVWARVVQAGRLAVVPALGAGVLLHQARGDVRGWYASLGLRAEASLRWRVAGGWCVEASPYYQRGLERGAKVLHGAGLRLGALYTFGGPAAP